MTQLFAAEVRAASKRCGSSSSSTGLANRFLTEFSQLNLNLLVSPPPRDTLPPKLISGELRVSGAGQHIERVA